MSGKKVLLHSELPLPTAHSLLAAQTSSASRPQLLRAGTVSCGVPLETGLQQGPSGDRGAMERHRWPGSVISSSPFQPARPRDTAHCSLGPPRSPAARFPPGSRWRVGSEKRPFGNLVPLLWVGWKVLLP